MNQPSPPAGPRRTRPIVLVVLGLIVLGALGWLGWMQWQAGRALAQSEQRQTEQRMAALEERIQGMRRDQRSQNQRIQDAAATNRVLRDELLGLSQRGALLEESVAELASSTRAGPQALRLDEVELLLGLGEQRLAIARDVDGARRAYALAASALEGVDDPKLINLRQALAQERAAVEALGEGQQARIEARLQRISRSLPDLQRRASRDDAPRPAWQRALAPLVDVRVSPGDTAISPTERAAGAAALQIELSLARAALERGDASGFGAALDRIDAWLPRLWAGDPALGKLRAELAALRTQPLQAQVPELGSTLEQLQALRGAAPAGPRNPLPPVAPPGTAAGADLTRRGP